MDSTGCFRCGMHNAMGKFKRVCRDCGYSHMSIELKEALRQVANYLWKLQKDVNKDAQEYRIESALDWARHSLETGGSPVNALGRQILRGMIDWRDYYPEGMGDDYDFDAGVVYPVVVKTLMPRLMSEEEDVLSGGGGPEGTFHIALDGIVQNMQVRGPLTAKTSYGRLTPHKMALQIKMEEWAFEMWTETQRLWHKDSLRDKET